MRGIRETCKDERGQASVEWSGLLFIVAIAFVAVMSFAAVIGLNHGRILGDTVLERILCAVRGGASCEREEELAAAYGEDMAATVRDYAPEIVYESGTQAMPVDFRLCRKPSCADGYDLPATVSRTRAGLEATAFTHVIDNRDKDGNLYLQYWLYYPDSRTGQGYVRSYIGDVLGPDHLDDWESYQVRIDKQGKVSARFSSHNWYSSCKNCGVIDFVNTKKCKGCDRGWQPSTGYNRVSGGSHANHSVAFNKDRERSTPSVALKLVPIKTLKGKGNYSFEVTPPWEKEVSTVPESGSTN